MLKTGEIDLYTIHSTCSEGFNLRKEGSTENILLPSEYGPTDLTVGQEVKAFTYLEDSTLIVATVYLPYALVGQYALMKAVEVKRFGAFVDWGLDKDLLIPENEQRSPIKLDEEYIVRVCRDERTQKIYGTTKINKYIQESEFDISETDIVSIEPVMNEELGYRCIINKSYIGMIYHNEVFQNIELGSKLKATVKKIREDGLVDLSLQALGFKNLVNAQDKILAYLKENGGSSKLRDKSSPEDIQKTLNMSKQTFKKTIGILYKNKAITLSKEGIKLT